MRVQDVMVICDVYCKWRDCEPIYRCWINDELFAERTWIWTNVYLEEQLVVRAVPGQYFIKFELVSGANAGLKIRNIRVQSGPGRIVSENCLEIYHETA